MTAPAGARPGPSKAPQIAKIEGQVSGPRKMVQAVLTDHLHHWAVNAARASEDGARPG